MKVVKQVAKTEENAKALVLKELNAQESEVVCSFNEIKGGLFKGVSYECTGFLKVDVILAVEEFITNIIKGLGLDVNLETIKKEDTVLIKLYTSNNPIIIGKNGQNLEALNILVNQFVKNMANSLPRFILDVSDYKDRQISRLEKLAKNLAREVIKTKGDIEMDSMNAFDRRVVHNALANFDNIKTESMGEEPNRKVVIKYITKDE